MSRNPHGTHLIFAKISVMEAAKNPDYLRAVAEAVTEFRQALEELLKLYVFNDWLARGMAPAVFPRDGISTQRLSKAHAKVSRAAGRASAAPPLTGMYINVQGAGPVDPIATWESITEPKPLLEPNNVLGACDQMLGRLEAMTIKAQAEAPPTIGAAAMHPLIWGAARGLWRDGHFRAAVAAAADSLVTSVKSRTKRNDVAETTLWTDTFSAQSAIPGKPRLRWPGDAADRDVINMNSGLRHFAPGVQMTIRNPAAHGLGEMSEQEALERLAALSLLARWVEDCRLEEDPVTQ